MKILLFGAGASIPFYPSLNTDFITKQIENTENWIKIIEKYNNYSSNPFNLKEIICLVNAICDKKQGLNFEDICGYIDAIANTLLHPSLYDKENCFGDIIHTLHNCEILELKKTPIRNIEYLPYLLRCIIIDAVINSVPNSNYNNLIKQQIEFINFVVKKNEKSSIISLNYDDVLNNTIGSKYNNGFHNQLAKTSPFSVEEFFRSKHTISYLHGNIRFYNSILDIHFSKDTIPNSIDRIKGVLGKKQKLCCFPFVPNNFSYNTFITTGKEKNISLDFLPYNYYYSKFASDITKSQTIITIGYSFRDQHVNRILSPFLKINKKNRIIIIDYYDKEIDCENDEIYHNIIIEIYKTFFPEEFPTNNDEKNIRQINTNGYGFLFPQVLFYKKGYEEFLNEYKQVINFCNKRIEP